MADKTKVLVVLSRKFLVLDNQLQQLWREPVHSASARHSVEPVPGSQILRVSQAVTKYKSSKLGVQMLIHEDFAPNKNVRSMYKCMRKD